MGRLERTAAAAAIATLCGAPVASFGQARPMAPPVVEEAPDAGAGDPGAPEGRPLPPVLPAPPGVLPRTDPGPGMGGRDCGHERSPGIGV